MFESAVNMTEVVEEKNKIFLKNLPLGTTREEVIRLFSNIGGIRDIILPKPRLGFVTTYGFVTFVDEKHVPIAISQYNNFEFCNSLGKRSVLSIVQAYQKVSHIAKHPVSCSLWSLDSHDSDKVSVGSNESSEPRTSEQEQEWIKERNTLLQIIDQNDKQIKELEKKNAEDNEDELLDRREKELLEELGRLPRKIETLKEEIEVLNLKVKLKFSAYNISSKSDLHSLVATGIFFFTALHAILDAIQALIYEVQ